MKRCVFRTLIAVAISILIATHAWAQKLVTPGYLFNSDPTCREMNGQFYLFTTQDPFTVNFEIPNAFFKGMYAYHALTTTDFDNWVDHGSILTGRDVSWNGGDALWDGDAGIPGISGFYAYAPFRVNSASEENYGTYDIGVFTSASPFGPYKDVYNAPMKMADGKPLEGLSPSIVRDDDGKAYLIWGSGDTEKHEVMLARLTPDMTQLAEAPRKLAVPTTDSCGNLEYFESPVLFHASGTWYLTWVAYKDDKGPGCDAKGSYVNYAMSSSLLGPFSGPVQHLVYPAGNGEESVQQGVCSYRGKSYLAYHVPYENVVGENDHHRQVAITELNILPDGTLGAIYPGRDKGAGTPGVTHLTLDAFAPRREAAEFHVRVNAEGEPGLHGEYQMKLGDGGYLGFHHMDFGSGALQFRVEVSSENSTLGNGKLEVRLDNPAGPLVSTIDITPTGGRTSYRILSAPVTRQATGMHDLCLVARGSSDTAQRRLFNVTWFAFDRR
ncbi:family 43 glycosylhydrolase [Terracidiphilus gabretensis]|uniref:family 43 glycosylhydrolase n=1 Tax=Terracidiphilus gabretensis TaxID=1577687 RepID=UPI0009E73182|nr:family 43 glycosylhydrolase [Terracidiphilus gabretensis]